jgi:hypothetical protein
VYGRASALVSPLSLRHVLCGRSLYGCIFGDGDKLRLLLLLILPLLLPFLRQGSVFLDIGTDSQRSKRALGEGTLRIRQQALLSFGDTLTFTYDSRIFFFVQSR